MFHSLFMKNSSEVKVVESGIVLPYIYPRLYIQDQDSDHLTLGRDKKEKVIFHPSIERVCLRDQLVLCLQFLSFTEAGTLVGLRGDGTDLFS